MNNTTNASVNTDVSQDNSVHTSRSISNLNDIKDDVKALDFVNHLKNYSSTSIKKVGTTHKALCPFHDDHNASLTIYNDGYHCEVCKAQGDIISWEQTQNSLNYVDALKKLAEDYSITIEYDNGTKSKSIANKKENPKTVVESPKANPKSDSRISNELQAEFSNYKFKEPIENSKYLQRKCVANVAKSLELDTLFYVGNHLNDSHNRFRNFSFCLVSVLKSAEDELYQGYQLITDSPMKNGEDKQIRGHLETAYLALCKDFNGVKSFDYAKYKIGLVEGIATGLSVVYGLQQANITDTIVIVCFNLGNIKNVFQRLPIETQIKIYADNDFKADCDTNAGLDFAKQLQAQRPNTTSIYFCDAINNDKTDFNDLHVDVVNGKADLSKLIEAVSIPKQIENTNKKEYVVVSTDKPKQEHQPIATKVSNFERKEVLIDIQNDALFNRYGIDNIQDLIIKGNLATRGKSIFLANDMTNARYILSTFCNLNFKTDVLVGKTYIYDSILDTQLSEINDALVDKITDQLNELLTFGNNRNTTFASETVSKAIGNIAYKNQFDPLVNYLKGLKTISTKDFDFENNCCSHFFIDHFGAIDDEYSRQVGIYFFVSLIARALHAGSKVDCMIVLEGTQGIGKSSSLRSLLPNQDLFVEATRRPNDLRFIDDLKGKWLVEIAELSSFNKAESSEIKQIITTQVDTYRQAYARYSQSFPRRCVFVGTTNDDNYIKDPTGGRRFLPIKCSGIIDNDTIASMRDDLFATALALFKHFYTNKNKKSNGWHWYDIPEAKEHQSERFDVDPWEPMISEYCLCKDFVTTKDIFTHLNFATKDIKKSDSNRIANILKRLGYESGRNTVLGKRTRGFIKIR